MLSTWIKLIRKNKTIIELIEKSFLGKKRAQLFYNMVKPCLPKGAKIVDIGAGVCTFSKLLTENGYKTTPVDVVDLSLYQEIQPVVYDGKKLPFKDKSHDVAVIITVLHHTRNQVEIIEEARRVAKKIIIIEDIYRNKKEQFITYLFDSLLNLEFFGHPHTNRSHEEWLSLFKKMGFKVLHKKIKRFNWMFLLGAYCIK